MRAERERRAERRSEVQTGSGICNKFLLKRSICRVRFLARKRSIEMLNAKRYKNRAQRVEAEDGAAEGDNKYKFTSLFK